MIKQRSSSKLIASICSCLFSKQEIQFTRSIWSILGLILTLNVATPFDVSEPAFEEKQRIGPIDPLLPELPELIILGPGSALNVNKMTVVGSSPLGNRMCPCLWQVDLFDVRVSLLSAYEGKALAVTKIGLSNIAVGSVYADPRPPLTGTLTGFRGTSHLPHPFGYRAAHWAEDITETGAMCGGAYLPGIATYAWYWSQRAKRYYRLVSSQYQEGQGDPSDNVQATDIDPSNHTTYGYEHIAGAPSISGYVACAWTGTNTVAQRLPRPNNEGESCVNDCDSGVAVGYTRPYITDPGAPCLWYNNQLIYIPISNFGVAEGVRQSVRRPGYYFIVGTNWTGQPYRIVFNANSGTFLNLYYLNSRSIMGETMHRSWVLKDAKAVDEYGVVVGSAAPTGQDEGHAYYLRGPRWWQDPIN